MIILVADDNALSRELIRKLLEGSGQVGEVRIPSDRCRDAAILATLGSEINYMFLLRASWGFITRRPSFIADSAFVQDAAHSALNHSCNFST